MQLGQSVSDQIASELPGTVPVGVSPDEIPSYVSITPRVGTQDYAAYWAATAPELQNFTDVQQAILYPQANIYPSIPISTSTPTGVTPSSTANWVQGITDLGKLGLTAYGQIQLMNLQKQLIAQGKNPLTAAQVSAMSPQLNFGLAPSTQNMLMYALLGGGALLLVMALTGKKR